MSAKKKRRQLPEEDLAAAVAEIINSPITRSNLSFLRPLATTASSEEEVERWIERINALAWSGFNNT